MDADKSALDNTLSPQQGPDGKAVDCSCVPKPTANHNSGALTCAGCNKAIQVACLVHQFKHAGAPKKYDWLLGFISHSGLSYNCPACKQMPRDSTLPAEGDSQPGIPSTQQCVLQDMHTMKLAICELKTQIISIANNLQATRRPSTLPAKQPGRRCVSTGDAWRCVWSTPMIRRHFSHIFVAVTLAMAQFSSVSTVLHCQTTIPPTPCSVHSHQTSHHL